MKARLGVVIECGECDCTFTIHTDPGSALVPPELREFEKTTCPACASKQCFERASRSTIPKAPKTSTTVPDLSFDDEDAKHSWLHFREGRW